MPTKALTASEHLHLLRWEMSRGKVVRTAYFPSPKAERAFRRLSSFDVRKARQSDRGGGLYALWMALSHLSHPMDPIEKAVEDLFDELYQLRTYEREIRELYIEGLSKGSEAVGVVPLHVALALSYIIPLSFYAELEDSSDLLRPLSPAFAGPGGETLWHAYEMVGRRLYIYGAEEGDVVVRTVLLDTSYILWNMSYGKDVLEVVRGVGAREDGLRVSKGALDAAVEEILSGSPNRMGGAIKASLCFYLSSLGGLLEEGRARLCPSLRK